MNNSVYIGPDIVKVLADELKESFLGKRVSSFYCDSDFLALEFGSKLPVCLFNIDFLGYGVYILPKSFFKRYLKGFALNSFFALNKYLSKAILVDVKQENYDRIIKLTFNKAHDNVFLFVEFMGPNSNLILTSKDYNVLWAAKYFVSSKRSIIRNKPYTLPEFNGIAPTQLDDLVVMFNKDKKLFAKLIRGVGKNPLDIIKTVDDIYFLCDFYLGKVKGVVQVYNKRAFVWRDVFDPERSVVYDKAYILLFDYKFIFWFARKVMQSISQKLKNLEKRICYFKKALFDFKDDFELLREAERFKRYGKLILDNLSDIKDASSKVLLKDWQNDCYVEVDLMGLSPVEAANYYFESYKRLLKSLSNQDYIKKREKYLYELNKLRDEIKFLEERLKKLKDSMDDGLKLKDMLFEKDLLKENFLDTLFDSKDLSVKYKQPLLKEEKPADKSFSFKKYEVEGFLVYVGLNSKGNEYVTFKLAKREDLWFHAKDIPGAHVIVKVNSRKVPENIIMFAASLAAFHSKARNAQKVNVDFTKRKYVKRIEGSKVSYKNQKTIVVNPFLWSKMYG